MKVKKPKNESDQNGEQPKKKYKMSRELESLLAFNAVLEFSPKESVSSKKTRKPRRSEVSSDEINLLNSLNIKRKKVTRSMITRPTDVGADRIIVFVDPMDEEADFWPPAMVIPTMEWDPDVEGVKPGQCLVKFFEDNETSKVLVRDLAVFDESKEPFLTFKKSCKTFLENSGVKAAIEYLKSGKTPERFRWTKWGQNIVNVKKATNIQPRTVNSTHSGSDQDSEQSDSEYYESERENEKEHDHDRNGDSDSEEEDEENSEEEEESEEDESDEEKQKNREKSKKFHDSHRRRKEKDNDRKIGRMVNHKRIKDYSSDSDNNVRILVNSEEALKEIQSLSKDEFSNKLFEFMEKKGQTIYRNPVLGYEPLDLKRLYEIVLSRGGMHEVSRNLQWRQVYSQMGIQNMSTSAAYSIRSNYEKYLYEFEKEHFKPYILNQGEKQEESKDFVKSEIPEENQETKPIMKDLKEKETKPNKQSPNDREETRLSHTPETPIRRIKLERSETKKFNVGDMVEVTLKKYKEPYTAKILEVSTIEDQEKAAKAKCIKFTEHKYFVHYHGWKSHYDEWVPESALKEMSAKGKKTVIDFSPLKTPSVKRTTIENGDRKYIRNHSHSDTDVSKKRSKIESNRDKSPGSDKSGENSSKRTRCRASLTACDISSDEESTNSESINQDDFVRKIKNADYIRESSLTPTPTPDPETELEKSYDYNHNIESEGKKNVLTRKDSSLDKSHSNSSINHVCTPKESNSVKSHENSQPTNYMESPSPKVDCLDGNESGDESKKSIRKIKRPKRNEDKSENEKTPKEDSPIPSGNSIPSQPKTPPSRQEKLREEILAIKEKITCDKIDFNNLFPGFEEMTHEERVKNITSRMNQLRSNYKQVLDRLVK